MPEVSILLPCYNAAATLYQSLDSLLSQTLQDFEIVAVDDGSTDNTLDILQHRASLDNRICIIQTPHRGIVNALNTGLAACRAPYVARMDSDDRAHPTRLEKQVSLLEDNPRIGVVSCLVSAFPKARVREGFLVYLNWLNGLIEDQDIRREIFIESPLPHPSVTFRRELVVGAGGYQDNGWAEDYDLWLRLYLAGAHFAKVPELLMDWREDPSRLTRTDSTYSLENFLRAKAHYLALGPLAGCDSVIIWGAGMTGRRISKHLQRLGVRLTAFIDVDKKKIGRTKRGLPIMTPQDIPLLWNQADQPALLSAVAARKARPLIRQYLDNLKLKEGFDWWFVA